MCAIAVASPMSVGALRAERGTRIVDGINWVRASKDLRTLKGSRRLARSARARARLMMRADFFAHPSRLRVRGFHRVGEVIAFHRGHKPRALRTLKRFGKSPPHRQLLLSRKYRRVGAARAHGRWRGTRATIWVIRVGKK